MHYMGVALAQKDVEKKKKKKKDKSSSSRGVKGAEEPPAKREKKRSTKKGKDESSEDEEGESDEVRIRTSYHLICARCAYKQRSRNAHFTRAALHV
jgi:hypothetical protein